MPDPTFMQAQQQVANPPGQEQVPPAGNMGALGVMGGDAGAPEAPASFGDPSQTMGQVSHIRDAIMGQFPNITTFDDPHVSMTPAQKIGFFAMAISNPRAAMEVVRQQQERHIERQKMAAEFNDKALTTASGILSAQHQAEMQIFEMHIAAANARRQDEQLQIEQERLSNEAALQKANEAHIALQDEETRANMTIAQQTEARQKALFDNLTGGGLGMPSMGPGAPGVPAGAGAVPPGSTAVPNAGPQAAQPPPVFSQPQLGMSTPNGPLPGNEFTAPAPIAPPGGPGSFAGGGGPRPPRVSTRYGMGANGGLTFSRDVTTGGPDEQMQRDPRFAEFTQFLNAIDPQGMRRLGGQLDMNQAWALFLSTRSGQPGDFGSVSPVPGNAAPSMFPPNALAQ